MKGCRRGGGGVTLTQKHSPGDEGGRNGHNGPTVISAEEYTPLKHSFNTLLPWAGTTQSLLSLMHTRYYSSVHPQLQEEKELDVSFREHSTPE